DLGLANNFDLIRDHVGTVLDWWQGELIATHSPVSSLGAVQISPTAFSDYLDIQVTSRQAGPLRVSLYNAAGRLVAHTELKMPENALHWAIPASLADGFYFCSLQSGRQVSTTKLVKMRR
ncbi:MAG: T9SS type A sorting domain-containing protein, partial [Saprospiraceae bacterium]